MRRLAVTGFAILYAVLVLGTSASRTFASIEAVSGSLKATHPAIRGNDESPHAGLQPGQKRMLQDQFVVPSPLTAAGISLEAERHVVFTMEIRARGQFRPTLPSRAPPFLS